MPTYEKTGEIYEFVCCPFCGLNRRVFKSGTWGGRKHEQPKWADKTKTQDDGRVKFNFVDPEVDDFIQFRERASPITAREKRKGLKKPQGFYKIKGVSLREVMQDKDMREKYKPLLLEIKEQCLKILNVFKKYGEGL